MDLNFPDICPGGIAAAINEADRGLAKVSLKFSAELGGTLIANLRGHLINTYSTLHQKRPGFVESYLF